MVRKLALALLFVPGMALAVGDETEDPTPTETTQVCEDGQIWDAETEACVVVESHLLDDGDRMEAVREFAHAGQYDDAMNALGVIKNQNADMVLTYYGFLKRKTGDWDGGMAYYDMALEQNPDNLLARSYLGMAMAERGFVDEAKAQLYEIVARGGRNSWPHWMLKTAIKNEGQAAY